MSYTETGYIKSIYGIIAESIKGEIMILIKSDYFPYQEQHTHTHPPKKRETENRWAPSPQPECRLLNCLLFFTLTVKWMCLQTRGDQSGLIQSQARTQDCQWRYLIYVTGAYKMGLVPFGSDIEIPSESEWNVWPMISSWSSLCTAIWDFTFTATEMWSKANNLVGQA